MRFLCLHGQGTNSRIFEHQTAALRRELGEEHEFDFIEGTVPSDPAPGKITNQDRTQFRSIVALFTLSPISQILTPQPQEIANLYPKSEKFYSWLNTSASQESLISQTTRGLLDLHSHISAEGPYDALLAFCQGAAVASTYLLDLTRKNPSGEHLDPTFKFAVFLSGIPPVDLDALEKGEWKLLKEGKGEVIKIPTVNSWGQTDQIILGMNCGEVLSGLCAAENGEVVVHGGGHEVVGAKDAAGLKGTVEAIGRVMERARMRR